MASLPVEVMGVSAAMRNAFIYLGLNAVRNITADLIAKHRFRPQYWLKHLEHIKWGKLTDSLLVTALAFPLLTSAKGYIHHRLGGSV